MSNPELKKKAAQIRLDALMSIHKAGAGYSGSVMSVIEILVSLYYGEILGRAVMNFDPNKPQWEDQDYLILSKGQAVPAQYAILADLGFFDKSELNFLGHVNSMLQPRPNAKVPGISASTVSNGHGLSVALGVALALKMDRKNNKVFAVLGDGELQSGQIWEAAMAASHYNLSNLIAFIDNNKVQAGGTVCSVMNIDPIQDKFESFGWNVIQVTNGHDFDQLLDAVSRAFTSNRKPVCIWCHTVAGRGIDFAEGKPGYQGVALSESEMSEVIPKLKQF